METGFRYHTGKAHVMIATIAMAPAWLTLKVVHGQYVAKLCLKAYGRNGQDLQREEITEIAPPFAHQLKVTPRLRKAQA